ncbi:hypothetical protein DFH11DRAFT_1548358 [Phellopilus nigrolimitatus]|nr:hypothetical protein DFH11DRAFT_1548358 [Phellopilus nigrolimitatus]
MTRTSVSFTKSSSVNDPKDTEPFRREYRDFLQNGFAIRERGELRASISGHADWEVYERRIQNVAQLVEGKVDVGGLDEKQRGRESDGPHQGVRPALIAATTSSRWNPRPPDCACLANLDAASASTSAIACLRSRLHPQIKHMPHAAAPNKLLKWRGGGGGGGGCTVGDNEDAVRAAFRGSRLWVLSLDHAHPETRHSPTDPVQVRLVLILGDKRPSRVKKKKKHERRFAPWDAIVSCRLPAPALKRVFLAGQTLTAPAMHSVALAPVLRRDCRTRAYDRRGCTFPPAPARRLPCTQRGRLSSPHVSRAHVAEPDRINRKASSGQMLLRDVTGGIAPSRYVQGAAAVQNAYVRGRAQQVVESAMFLLRPPSISHCWRSMTIGSKCKYLGRLLDAERVGSFRPDELDIVLLAVAGCQLQVAGADYPTPRQQSTSHAENLQREQMQQGRSAPQTYPRYSPYSLGGQLLKEFASNVIYAVVAADEMKRFASGHRTGFSNAMKALCDGIPPIIWFRLLSDRPSRLLRERVLLNGALDIHRCATLLSVWTRSPNASMLASSESDLEKFLRVDAFKAHAAHPDALYGRLATAPLRRATRRKRARTPSRRSATRVCDSRDERQAGAVMHVPPKSFPVRAAGAGDEDDAMEVGGSPRGRRRLCAPAQRGALMQGEDSASQDSLKKR